MELRHTIDKIYDKTFLPLHIEPLWTVCKTKDSILSVRKRKIAEYDS